MEVMEVDITTFVKYVTLVMYAGILTVHLLGFILLKLASGVCTNIFIFRYNYQIISARTYWLTD